MAGADQPHVLVVDDDDRLRDLLTRYLGENGFSVSAACNALEARSSLAGLQFDLIVLDVLMPGEKGVDLARDLRKRIKGPDPAAHSTYGNRRPHRRTRSRR